MATKLDSRLLGKLWLISERDKLTRMIDSIDKALDYDEKTQRVPSIEGGREKKQ